MPPIVKDLFLSKKFVVAFLTFGGAIGTYFGWNVDPAKILAFISPFLLYIGAQGWADAGKEKAKIDQETAMKMHAMTLASAQPIRAPGVEIVKNPQAGFGRVGMLMYLALGFGAPIGIAAFASCSSTQTVVTDVIDCAKAEGQVVTSGLSVIQVVSEVIGVLSGKVSDTCKTAQDPLLCEVEHLALKFGGDIVACVLDDVPGAKPPAGPGPIPQNPQASFMYERAHSVLQRKFPGKKIVHQYKGTK